MTHDNKCLARPCQYRSKIIHTNMLLNTLICLQYATNERTNQSQQRGKNEAYRPIRTASSKTGGLKYRSSGYSSDRSTNSDLHGNICVRCWREDCRKTHHRSLALHCRRPSCCVVHVVACVRSFVLAIQRAAPLQLSIAQPACLTKSYAIFVESSPC